MNSDWIKKSLEYHGLPLKSIWDGERGEQELHRLGLSTAVDYTTYRNRSKYFGGLAERRVRSQLHRFIAKNAPALFAPDLVSFVSSTTLVDVTTARQVGVKHLPVVSRAPPFECFLGGQGSVRSQRIYEVNGNMIRLFC